ncbi:MAG TPA: CHASE domain-containing protein [Methyloversatilis sp.]
MDLPESSKPDGLGSTKSAPSRPSPGRIGWTSRLAGVTDRETFAWAVLALSVLVTLALWYSAREESASTARERFEYRAERQAIAVVDKLSDLTQVLHGAAGLFAASEDVSRSEWHEYVKGLQLDRIQPGTLGMGFALMVPPAERAAHEAAVRAEGFPDYAIRPSGERPQLSSILYLEPFSGANLRAFGYDMYSEPVRRAAMERARDTGHAALSGRVVLVQEDGSLPRPGFLIYLPVYRNHQPVDTVEARRKVLRGFVYSPFRAEDLLRRLFEDAAADVEIEIFDGDPIPANALFSSEHSSRVARHVIDKTVEYGGRRWTLRVRSSLSFEVTTESEQPTVALAGGLAIDLLFFGMLFLHARHRRRMEAATAELQLSHERFRTLVGNVPGTVFRCEPDAVRQVRYISDGIEALTGKRPERYLSGQYTLGQLVHPDDLPELRRTVDGAVARGESYEIEYRVNGASGLWVSERGRATLDGAGRPLWIDGVMFDISSQKRAAAQLRAASMYARSLIEVSLDPLVTISAEGKVTDVNSATEAVTGVTRQQLIGSDFSDYFTEPEKAQAGYRQVFSDGRVIDYPLTIRHVSGRLTEVLYNASVYRDEEGRVAGVFAAARDVTRLNAMVSELDRHRNNLEELVDTRTRELAAAKRAAESANEAKSVFLSSMSHELRTPMNAIIGMAHILQGTELAPRQKELLGNLQTASRQLLALIDDILNFVRLDNGRAEVQKQVFQLGDMLETVVGKVGSKALARGVAVFLDVPPGMPCRFSGGVAGIGQVLDKLVDNAVKFTEAGEVRVGVTMVEHGRNAAVLRFEVRDTGIGIDDDERKRLFDVFHQIDGSSTRKYGGTGLGLAMVRRLVELLGGEIGVESEKGKGSVFWFTAPVEVVDDAAASHAEDAGTGVAAGNIAARSGEAANHAGASIPRPAARSDGQQWDRLRERLMSLLEADDLESVRLFRDNEALMRAALGTRYASIEQAIGAFDLATALDEIRSCA